MKKNKKLIAIAALLFIFILFLSKCIYKKNLPDARGTAFAPEQKCRQCHQAIYDSALLSAHYNASAIATEKNVMGNFATGHNRFIYDSVTKVVMQKTDSGFYQVLYKNNTPTLAKRFDIIFGKRHAQTSLYWQNDQTFELPISFYPSINEWATSPGFSATTPNFTRLIGTDCFECHSSYISNKKNSEANNYFASKESIERLEKQSLIVGIGCQRCHGAAAEHVNFHEENPTVKTAAYIVSTKTLNRQQQLDGCAVCHGGNDKRKIKSRFMYKPGDMLANYFLPSTKPDSATNFDVHGNQFNLLKQSKCFLQSSNMTCNTCHNTHNNTPPTVATSSQKCMSCHSQATANFCTVTPAAGIILQNNCIDCHMPKLASSAISFQLSGSSASTNYLLRTHKIGVYGK
jgi:hypothetical protein